MTLQTDNSIVQDGQGPEGDLTSLRKILAAVTPRVERTSRWKKFSKVVLTNGFAACLTFLAAFAAFLLSPIVPMDTVREAVAAAKAEWTPAPFLPNDLPARQASWADEPDETDVESAPTGIHYRNCAAAWAAGAAPISIGEPGYESRLDGDGDGIACEPFRRRRR